MLEKFLQGRIVEAARFSPEEVDPFVDKGKGRE